LVFGRQFYLYKKNLIIFLIEIFFISPSFRHSFFLANIELFIVYVPQLLRFAIFDEIVEKNIAKKITLIKPQIPTNCYGFLNKRNN